MDRRFEREPRLRGGRQARGTPASLLLKDTSGQELYEINKSLAHVHTTFEVKQGDKVVATIQKA